MTLFEILKQVVESFNLRTIKNNISPQKQSLENLAEISLTKRNLISDGMNSTLQQPT